MKLIKRFLRKVVPNSVIEWRKKRNLARTRARNMNRSTREVFSEIYATGLWGGSRGEFCSGSGSTLEMTRDYCTTVRTFIEEHGIKSVLDLGCGDFAVGRNLQVDGVCYLGADIVPSLIQRNQQEFGSETTQFRCIDIIAQPLPEAELCLIRQVFQHLSNSQIVAVLEKLKEFRYVIVTEHYPAHIEDSVPNHDKPHGGDTRIVDNSAVFLDHPPFNLYEGHLFMSTLVSQPLVSEGETIQSFLIQNG